MHRHQLYKYTHGCFCKQKPYTCDIQANHWRKKQEAMQTKMERSPAGPGFAARTDNLQLRQPLFREGRD